DGIEEARNEVETFLLHEAGDDADDRGARRNPQAALLLQGCLVHGLWRWIARVIAGGDRGVHRGIPDSGIDPVENADEGVAALAQQAVQPLAMFRSLDLIVIGR